MSLLTVNKKNSSNDNLVEEENNGRRNNNSNNNDNNINNSLDDDDNDDGSTPSLPIPSRTTRRDSPIVHRRHSGGNMISNAPSSSSSSSSSSEKSTSVMSVAAISSSSSSSTKNISTRNNKDSTVVVQCGRPVSITPNIIIGDSTTNNTASDTSIPAAPRTTTSTSSSSSAAAATVAVAVPPPPPPTTASTSTTASTVDGVNGGEATTAATRNSNTKRRMESLEIDMGDHHDDDIRNKYNLDTIHITNSEDSDEQGRVALMGGLVRSDPSKSFDSEDGTGGSPTGAEERDMQGLLDGKNKKVNSSKGNKKNKGRGRGRGNKQGASGGGDNMSSKNDNNEGDGSCCCIPCCSPNRERIGNMKIICPRLYYRYGFGIMGPHYMGPPTAFSIIWIVTLFLVHKSLQHDRYVTVMLCTFFAIITTYQLILTSYSDPGVVRKIPGTSPQSSSSPPGRNYRWCDLCENYQPPNGAHCPDCDICIAGYDHHCVWMGTCIGHANFKSFVRFNICWLLYLAYVIIWISIITPIITLRTNMIQHRHDHDNDVLNSDQDQQEYNNDNSNNNTTTMEEEDQPHQL